jgi:hypothetical protein
LTGQPTGVAVSAPPARPGCARQSPAHRLGSAAVQPLEEKAGEGPYVLAPTDFRSGWRQVALGSSKATQHRAALIVKQDVLGFDGAVLDTEVMQVGHSGGDSGPKSGDHLNGLGAQVEQVAAGHSPQHQRVRGVASLHSYELHDAGMGQSPQES